LLAGSTVSLMKLGYLLASIAVNVQQKGLCAQEEQEEEGSNSEQIGEGIGIGEG
jgi:hypothetical protein